LCQPKIQGGLGIQNLDLQNKYLLSKWLYKLLNEKGLWQELLRNKYIKDKTLGSCTKKPIDSHFWKGLMNVKDTFMSYGCFNIKDGSQTCFWLEIHNIDEKKPGLMNVKDTFMSYGCFNIVNFPCWVINH
jgi:hypothetical protein